MRKFIGLVAISACAAFGTSVQANGFYFGLGLGYTHASSDAGGPAGLSGSGSSKLEAGIGGLTAGYRWDLARGFAAAEVDADFALSKDFSNTANGNTCSTAASGAYYCTHKATVRLRGLYGVPVGQGWEVFGALGIGAMTGDGATNTLTADRGTNAGVTLGIGAQRSLGTGKLRIELTHDQFDNTIQKPHSVPLNVDYTPSYQATSIKLSYIMQF